MSAMGTSRKSVSSKIGRDVRPRKVVAAFRLNGVVGRNLLAGVFRYLGGSGNWNLRLAQGVDELLAEIAGAAAAGGADGFLISAPFASDEVLTALSAGEVPVSFIDVPPARFAARRRNVAFVRNDDGGIGLLAARHLSSLGNFRSYGFVATVQPRDWCSRREKGFRAGLAQRGLSCATYAADGHHDAARDRTRLTKWLKALPKPAAVLAAFDERGMQVLECCHDGRISVPGQIALLGVDNDELLCENTMPPLASIAPDSETEGMRAAATLDKMMRDGIRRPRRPEIVVCRVKGVVERASAAPIAPAGHLIRRALAFIRRNAARNIGVPDVVAHLGVSRRLADKRFREYQDESILQTITRMRLEEVKRRLRETHASINAITAACGFPDANYLKALFRRHVGMTMRDYRRT